jgi:DNA helicase HerA-like ATPase
VHLPLDKLQEVRDRHLQERAQGLFAELFDPSQYVGEVFSMGYESATVIVHDSYRQEVGGIPSLSFLVATRIRPGEQVDPDAEDSSVLLLRVMDAAPLPDHSDAERKRADIARRASGHDTPHWDDRTWMDLHTNHELGYAGVRCRVIGTFFIERIPDAPSGAELELRFGSDISNYYPNRGLKVFKPTGRALARIVNFRAAQGSGSDESAGRSITVGHVRYASTHRPFQGVSEVPVELVPEDLLGQKTALFGMTRTGKSNTTKIIIQSVFDLRYVAGTRRIGQLVFDPNGEYANENEQDAQGAVPTAVKNVGRSRVGEAARADVVTYGILEHINDRQRKLMLLNFYEEENLQTGKLHIDEVLASESAGYVKQFREVQFVAPEQQFGSAATRYARRVLAYRALLKKADFEVPEQFRARTVHGRAPLFGRDLLDAMEGSESDNSARYRAAAKVFASASPTWDQLASAFKGLQEFMDDSKSGYRQFEETYLEESNTGDKWADDDLRKILAMFRYDYGSRRLGEARRFHTKSTSKDYAAEIYEHLIAGRLVIVDQSSGEYAINEANARRVLQHVFDQQQKKFRSGTPTAEMPEVLVYAEEAHNLLPAGSDADFQNIWVKTAKEAAKLHIGLVYATQEVSSIQRNILKNTANWFIGHLNNTDETKELGKYYDFEDFLPSIRRAADKGFIRVKTLSNPYVVPVQIRLFQVG